MQQDISVEFAKEQVRGTEMQADFSGPEVGRKRRGKGLRGRDGGGRGRGGGRRGKRALEEKEEEVEQLRVPQFLLLAAMAQRSKEILNKEEETEQENVTNSVRDFKHPSCYRVG